MYKASKYNFFAPYKEKVIYHNSLRGNSFAMTMSEHLRIRKLFEDPISFSLEYPSVFAQFYRWGFFVDTHTDEVAVFRYLYNKDVVFRSDYHLVLINTAQQAFSSDFIVPVAKHIKQTLESKEVRMICIEWSGHNVLNTFKPFIHPLFIKAQKLCEKSGVELLGQIEVKMSNNAVIHNKLYHNRGIPTYESTLDTIQHLIRQYPFIRLRVRINAFPSDATARDTFLEQFDSIAHERVHWIWGPHYEQEKDEVENAKKIAAIFQNRLGEDYTVINPEQTYALSAPRKNVAVIEPDRNVYMSVPPDSPEVKQAVVGTLNETDGSIQWDEAEREKRLSMLWYEWKKCKDCPYLPLFAAICPLLNIQIGLVCPIKNKMIDPEAVIIKEFESKQK